MTGSDGDRDLIDLSRTGQVVPPPDDAEVERAIASVPGVTSASLRRDPDSGRTRLRLRLRAGEDAEQAAWSIAATLRERFGIALDPASIRPVAASETAEPEAVEDTEDTEAVEETEGVAQSATPGTDSDTGGVVAEPDRSERQVPPPPSALSLTPPPPPRPMVTAEPGADAAASDAAALDAAGSDEADPDLAPVPDRSAEPASATTPPQGSRATIHRLDIERGAREVQATVALLRGDQAAQGVARAVPTTRSILRAIAEATASALQQFMTAPVLIGIDRIEVEPAADPARVLVSVTILADRGEEQLLGASLVRGDAERAVVRATLDALNRRVSPFLSAPPQREAAAS